MALGKKSRKRPGSMSDLGISHVGLRVTDLHRSLRFYRNILGLKGRAGKQGVAYIPSAGDILVLHERGYGSSDFHFGFHVDSPSGVERWRAWLRSKSIRIYQDVSEEKYRSLKVRDPDGHWIEITYDGRETALENSNRRRKPGTR